MKQPFNFIVKNDKLGDSVLPLSWCVSHEVLQEIADKKILNPHVLIIVTRDMIVNGSDKNDPIHYFEETERILVPLKQALVYITFHSAGSYQINGVVIGATDNRFRTLHESVIDRHRIAIYQADGDLAKAGDLFNDSDSESIHVLGNSSLKTVVSPDLFAPEPSPWEKRWVNKWFRTQPVDQCSYRRRKIFAYTLKPFLFAFAATFWFISRIIITTIVTILGYRGINYATILHPLRDDYDEMISETRSITDSIFLSNESLGIRPLAWPLYPIIPLLVLFINSWESLPTDDGKVSYAPVLSYDHLLLGLKWYGLILLGYYSFSIVILILSWMAPAVEKLLNKVFMAPKTWTQVPESELLKRQEANLNFLSCEHRTNVEPGIASVPKENRTIYLWYQDTKAKICKPFQRNY